MYNLSGANYKILLNPFCKFDDIMIRDYDGKQRKANVTLIEINVTKK